ncbi:hypothetical protein [Almyronema epifaneia]|uniref:DUF2029 domain-containing protein n=1 Tax=Almyronema epifaneia S1 TaxID=2991925 RepID=A0ABW6I920_9CYAN
MAACAFARLTYEFNRLLWQADSNGAIDLRQRYEEVSAWFLGQPVYGEIPTAVYPPASYLMLRPFLHYASFADVRYLWAITTVVALGSLILAAIWISLADRPSEYAVLALLVVAIYATGPSIGNGQLTIHILAALVVGLLLLLKPTQSLGTDLAGSSLIVFTLIKPTLTVPFIWLFVFALQRLRPLFLILLGYSAIALFACTFQAGSVWTLYHQWLKQGMGGAVWSSAGGGGLGRVDIGYANIHNYLGALKLSQFNLSASLALLLILGIWIQLHRQADVWILVGVAAIMARLWTYHLVYDDMLVLLPMIALFRLQKQGLLETKAQAFNETLLITTIFMNLLPASLRLANSPLDSIFTAGVTLDWMLLMGWLAWQAAQQKTQRLFIPHSTQ